MISLQLMSALWLTLKIPFLLTVNGEQFTIGHNELSRYHGGWTMTQECSHCGEDNVVSFDLSKCDVINVDDLNNVR